MRILPMMRATSSPLFPGETTPRSEVGESGFISQPGFRTGALIDIVLLNGPGILGERLSDAVGLAFDPVNGKVEVRFVSDIQGEEEPTTPEIRMIAETADLLTVVFP